LADLTTLANVKQAMNLPATAGASDALLSRRISAYSQWFMGQVNRGGFLSTAYTETRSGHNGNEMITKNYPITAVQGVTINGDALSPVVFGTYGSNSYGFGFDDFGIQFYGGRYWRGCQNVVLQYTAGYTTVPFDVEEAVINQLIFMQKRMPTIDITSQSQQGAIVAAFSQKEMAPGVKSVIDSYRSSAVIGL
jgi:hypothetical protein